MMAGTVGSIGVIDAPGAGSNSTTVGAGPRASRLVALMPVAAAVVTMLAFAPFAPLGVDGLHDGYVLKPALDVLSGKTLFKETMSQYGPLATYLQAGFLAMLGPKLLSLKLGTVAMYGLTAGFLTAAWLRFLPVSLTLFSLALWLTLAYFYDPSGVWIMLAWPSVYSLTFQAMALYFLLKSAPVAGSWRTAFALLCGVSAGLCFWCRFNVGIPLFAALGASYVIFACAAGERPWKSRRLFAFIGGSAAVHLAFLSVIAVTGVWADWFYQNFTFSAKVTGVMRTGSPVRDLLSTVLRAFRCLLVPPQQHASFQSHLIQAVLPMVAVAVGLTGLTVMLMRSGFARKSGAGRTEPPPRNRFVIITAVVAFTAMLLALGGPPSDTTFWYFAVPNFFAAGVLAVLADWLVARVRGGDNPSLAEADLAACAAGLVAMASWTQYYPLPDVRHLYWAIAPGIGVFAYYVQRLVRGRSLVVALGLGLLMVPLVFQRGELIAEKLRLVTVPVRNNPVLEGMKLYPDQEVGWSSYLAALDGYLKKRPDTPILVYGHDQIHGCLVTNLRNPSKYWMFSGEFPVPEPEKILDARRAFIREDRPLIVFQWYDLRLTKLSWQPSPESLEKNDAMIRDLKANLEDIVRNFGYKELCRSEHGDSVLILLGPPD